MKITKYDSLIVEICLMDQYSSNEERLIAKGSFDLRTLQNESKSSFEGQVALEYEGKPAGHVNIRFSFHRNRADE